MMERALSILRFLAASAAMTALLVAPAVRAAAERAPARAGKAALSSACRGDAGSRPHHPPRPRRIHVSVLPPVDGAVAAPCPARRGALPHRRLTRVSSFVPPVDHPPA